MFQLRRSSRLVYWPRKYASAHSIVSEAIFGVPNMWLWFPAPLSRRLRVRSQPAYCTAVYGEWRYQLL